MEAKYYTIKTRVITTTENTLRADTPEEAKRIVFNSLNDCYKDSEDTKYTFEVGEIIKENIY